MILTALIWKELKENVKAYISFLTIMVIFGMLSVVLLYLMPELLPEELKEVFPKPTVIDALKEFFDNIIQIGGLLTVLIASGAIAKEIESNTLEILLVRPIKKEFIVISKFISRTLVIMASIFLAALITWIYSKILGEFPLNRFLIAVVPMLSSLIFICSISILVSTFSKSQISSGAASIGTFIVLMVVQSFTIQKIPEGLRGLYPLYGASLSIKLLSETVNLTAYVLTTVTPIIYSTIILIISALIFMNISKP